MSRTGWSGTNFLRYAGSPIAAEPLSMSAWIYNPSYSAVSRILGIYNSASVANRDQWALMNNGSGNIIARSADTVGQASAQSSTTASNGVWAHAAAVFASTTSRAAYLNGGSKGTNSTSKVITGPNQTSMGQQDNAGGTRENQDSDVLLAEAAIWSIALSDPEIAALAAGASPKTIQSGSLVFYAPLIGDWSPEIERISAQNLMIQGSLSQGAHPPAQLLPYYNVGTLPEMLHPGKGVFSRTRFFQSPRFASGVSSASGTLSATLADVSLASTATLKLAATLASTLADATLSSATTLKIVGALAVILANTTLSSAAQLEIKASLAATLADAALSAAAQLEIHALLARTLDDATLVSIVQSVVHGDFGVTLEDAVLVATGNDGWTRRGNAGGSWTDVATSTDIWAPVGSPATTWEKQ